MLTDYNNKNIGLHLFYYGFVMLLCYDGTQVTFKEFNGNNKANFKTETEKLLNDNVAVYIVPTMKKQYKSIRL